jgi:enoyl-CoA hydratase
VASPPALERRAPFPPDPPPRAEREEQPPANPMQSMADESDIILDRRGTAGIVTLNRPAALNAVNRTMVRGLRGALERWRDDDGVSRVIVTAAGGRAFSAGGDLRAIYEAGRSGRQRESLDFWREEYALNTTIRQYPKPYVALIDGIVMGGGVGVSVHGSHRVAGDRFEFAMPEVGIGFFPDVGATWVLPRLPGEIGTYCALTGARLKAADAMAAGIATHRVPSAPFAEVAEALCGAEPVDAVLAKFARTPLQQDGAGDVTVHRSVIDRAFAADSVEDILARLDAEAAGAGAGADAGWAAGVAATMRGRAPLSLKIALAQMRRGRHWSFAECMQAEFRIVSRVVYGHDFYEGIRAVIIDKDNRPRWEPATLADVTAAAVDGHFSPLESELVVPAAGLR